MKKTLTILSLLVGTTSAIGQQVDPYANAYQNQRMKVYQEQRENFMNGVKVISFARHCGVIPNYGWFIGHRMLQMLALQTIGNDYPPDYPLRTPTPWRFKFRSDVGTSWQVGRERAKEEGCEFWKQNTDIVYSIREMVRVSDGVSVFPYWFPSLQDANNRGTPQGPTLIDQDAPPASQLSARPWRTVTKECCFS